MAIAGKKAAVIGAGLGGLSAAVRLAHKGWKVDVYEAGSDAGGKAGSISAAGYRWDSGPSLLTMPEVLKQLFTEIGEDMEKWIRPVKLPVICQYRLSDDTLLNAYADTNAFAEEIEAKTEDSAESVMAYLNYSREIYKRTGFLFLQKSLHELDSYLDRKALKTMLNIGKIDPFRTMHRANRTFFRDPRVIQLFDRYATYNGSSPFQVPATLNIIPHVEYGLGGYGVEGGIRAIPAALQKLAEKRGVRFHFNTPVERILTTTRRVSGVEVRGEKLDYPVVISNADVKRTYTMLGDTNAPWAQRYRRLEPSSSGLVFFWGMGRKTDLSVNNIFFSSDYPGEFRSIFQEGRCPQDPTVYVNITSKITPSDAPVGGENWFVLVNAPGDTGQNWEEETALTRKRVRKRLSRALGREVLDSIDYEEVMTPSDIAARTGSPGGSLYGISSNSRSAAFNRHPNRSRRHRGLYFCGGSAHPGGGMPLVILSGKIAANLIQKYEK